MNLVDTQVIEVLSEPEFHEYDWGTYWTKKLKVDCWGSLSETEVHAFTKEDLDKYVVGYIYQS